MAPLVRTGGSRHTGLAALPHRNIHTNNLRQFCQQMLHVVVNIQTICTGSLRNTVDGCAGIGSSTDALNIIQTKCDYYKMLIITHARGEYLVYQLLISDTGLLSDFRVLFDAFKEPGETTESWYNGQIRVMLKYYDILNSMFVIEDANMTTTDLGNVPQDVTEFNGHFYYVYNLDTVSTWNEAKQYCENQGGYLATITSPEENEFVYSYLNDVGYESAYFGFTDLDEEGIWVWDNGEVSSYTNWHSGEPNGENPNEDFAMFYYKYSDGTWNDGDFGKQTVNSGVVFICEWGEYIVGTTPTSGNHYETDSTGEL